MESGFLPYAGEDAVFDFDTVRLILCHVPTAASLPLGRRESLRNRSAEGPTTGKILFEYEEDGGSRPEALPQYEAPTPLSLLLEGEVLPSSWPRWKAGFCGGLCAQPPSASSAPQPFFFFFTFLGSPCLDLT